ncbi:biotin/lipoyl-binding protein, partial [bacterium]|nr:biotin/lipoyl-binding protein [bacterium]
MSHQIKIPPVGESVVSALVARWHVADGATVEKGQTLVTLETDKVSNELEAEVAGTVSITVQEGEEVEIGTVIGLIAEGAASGGSAPAPAPEAQAAPQEALAPVVSGPTGEKIDIVAPAAGESITSATVAAWAVSNNDFVKKGQVLVTLDTDKVSSELEAEASGVVSIEVSEGTEVSIGEKLGSIAVSEAPAPPALVASDPEPVKAAAPAVPTPALAPVV